jgi:hypothetical protein
VAGAVVASSAGYLSERVDLGRVGDEPLVKKNLLVV